MPLFKKEKKQKPITSAELLKKIEDLEQALKETRKEVTGLKKHVLRALCKVGIVRFNAFREIGGNQSFSVALLDEEKNGVVITSYYGRDLNRVYAKAVENGDSKHELGEEEKQAITRAIDIKAK